MLKLTVEQLHYIIQEGLKLDYDELLEGVEYGELLNETVSMWIDPRTDKKLDDKAAVYNMPSGALASIYRKGLAAWLEKNRFGKGKDQHIEALSDVQAFITNKNNLRSNFPVEWNRVKKYRIKKHRKEEERRVLKLKKQIERERKKREREKEKI